MARTAAAATAAPGAAGMALPTDVRWMNIVSRGLIAGVLLLLLAAAIGWASRAQLFTIRGIDIEGELTRNSLNTLRANAMPRLSGNFFSADLQAARQAFESVPWVRHAVVRRVWPNRLAVELHEHRAAALWQGDDRGDRLVNEQGEVFEANVGDVEDEALPIFSGPDGSAPQMLAMYRALQPVLAGMKAEADTLVLSGRGSWRVTLDSGATLELGRGSQAEVLERTARFVRTLPTLVARFPQQPLEAADLRHTDGYALKLRGVTTNPTGPAGAAPTKN